MVKKLHTATHLLHKALRIVLGDHVAQKGSNITAERLRFDFSHPEKMTSEQLSEVEAVVNDQITKNLPVHFEVMTLENAKKHSEKEELVAIDCQVADGTEGISARLIVPKRFAHVAYAGKKLFVPTQTNNPTYQVIMFFDEGFEKNKSKSLPEKDVTIRIAFSKDGEMVKIVRNSNYFGEWKKGVFAGEDWRTKQSKKAIFLHAGCRQDYLEMAHGGYETQKELLEKEGIIFDENDNIDFDRFLWHFFKGDEL